MNHLGKFFIFYGKKNARIRNRLKFIKRLIARTIVETYTTTSTEAAAYPPNDLVNKFILNQMVDLISRSSIRDVLFRKVPSAFPRFEDVFFFESKLLWRKYVSFVCFVSESILSAILLIVGSSLIGL